jgi:hypothetical protein
MLYPAGGDTRPVSIYGKWIARATSVDKKKYAGGATPRHPQFLENGKIVVLLASGF